MSNSSPQKLSLAPRRYMDSLAARAMGVESDRSTLIHIVAWGVCIVVVCTIMGFGR